MPNIPLISPQLAPAGPRLVEMLVFPRVQLLDVTGPLQVFSTTNDLVTEAGGKAPYATRVVAAGGGRVVSSSGLEISVAPLPPPGRPLDTLMIAGGKGVHPAAEDARLVRWVDRRARSARRTASVCTGATLLAATGLLDGRRVTTHWSFCEELARRHPDVHVEKDPIFVRDGDYWTSAGITAGIDLSLALVEEDLGAQLALAVARYLVVFLKRPGGQAQFSETLTLQAGDDRFGALHQWMGSNLSRDLSLPRLAEQAGMSERSFSRRYLEATGQTPARAVERLRVEAARRLLSSSRLPVKRIAGRCGFGSEETMRRSFLRILASTPQDYRARFGA